MNPTPTAKLMATPAGQARNEEIFQAAAELMVQRGYVGTSMGDLAEAVGMTKAGLYHHISSKQDMLFKILQHAMEGLEREVIAPTQQLSDPEERLREMIRLHVRGLFDSGLEIALLFPERRHLESAQQQEVDEQIKHYRDLIRKALSDLADEGKLQDLDIDVTASHIMQTIVGIARWYTKDKGVTEARLIEETVNFNLSAILKNA